MSTTAPISDIERAACQILHDHARYANHPILRAWLGHIVGEIDYDETLDEYCRTLKADATLALSELREYITYAMIDAAAAGAHPIDLLRAAGYRVGGDRQYSGDGSLAWDIHDHRHLAPSDWYGTPFASWQRMWDDALDGLAGGIVVFRMHDREEGDRRTDIYGTGKAVTTSLAADVASFTRSINEIYAVRILAIEDAQRAR
jgi:hypothetical protein